jgi:hypothetical protein
MWDDYANPEKLEEGLPEAAAARTRTNRSLDDEQVRMQATSRSCNFVILFLLPKSRTIHHSPFMSVFQVVMAIFGCRVDPGRSA